MTIDISEKYVFVARRLMQEMFDIKPGEVIAITSDKGSDPVMVQAFFNACLEVGAKPMAILIPQAENNGQAGLPDWPADALTAALKTVDVWLEVNESFMLYSDIWETTMRENPKIRYNVLAGSTVDSLERVFCNFDIGKMEKILNTLAGLAKNTKMVRVTTERGTDVSFTTDPSHLIDYDSGDFSKKNFCTAPGYLNLVPKRGSTAGKIVFDMIMHADLSAGGRVEFELKEGRIAGYKGADSDILQKYVASFNEDNMSKISHMMLGLCPGVQELSWEIVEDERLWGGCDFGFGHTSPIDMPPDGQPASSHFDGVVQKASVWFDTTQILENGVVVLASIKEDSEALLAEYNAASRKRP